MKLTERKITTTLHRNGYKLTPQRQAVIDTMVTSQDMLTAASIYKKVSREHPYIGLVTVYRTLELLSRLGLICELHSGSTCPAYTSSNREHHHHLICSVCGKVVDFIGHDLTSLEDRISHESGFQIQNHILEFIGVCSACQKTE